MKTTTTTTTTIQPLSSSSLVSSRSSIPSTSTSTSTSISTLALKKNSTSLKRKFNELFHGIDNLPSCSSSLSPQLKKAKRLTSSDSSFHRLSIQLPVYDPYSHESFLRRLKSYKFATFLFPFASSSFSGASLNPISFAAHGWTYLHEATLMCEVCKEVLLLSAELETFQGVSSVFENHKTSITYPSLTNEEEKAHAIPSTTSPPPPSSSFNVPSLFKAYETWMKQGHTFKCGWFHQSCPLMVIQGALISPSKSIQLLDQRIQSLQSVEWNSALLWNEVNEQDVPEKLRQRYPTISFTNLICALHYWSYEKESMDSSFNYLECGYCGRQVSVSDSFHPISSHLGYCFYRQPLSHFSPLFYPDFITPSLSSYLLSSSSSSLKNTENKNDPTSLSSSPSLTWFIPSKLLAFKITPSPSSTILKSTFSFVHAFPFIHALDTKLLHYRQTQQTVKDTWERSRKQLYLPPPPVPFSSSSSSSSSLSSRVSCSEKETLDSEDSIKKKIMKA